MICAFLFSLAYHIIKTRLAWQADRSRGLPVSTRGDAVLLRASLAQLLRNFVFQRREPDACFVSRSIACSWPCPPCSLSRLPFLCSSASFLATRRNCCSVIWLTRRVCLSCARIWGWIRVRSRNLVSL